AAKPAAAKPAAAPAPDGIAQLLGNRLRIAGAGLRQLRDLVITGTRDDVLQVIGKLEEDLELLRRRIDTAPRAAMPAPRLQVRRIEHDIPANRVARVVEEAEAVGVR